ncbi:MAG: hypothetical protein ABI592_07770 [Acidobacteriota bacterium]
MASLRILRDVAVVSPAADVAKDAASRLAGLVPDARLVPLTAARYLAGEPLPLILAPRGSSAADDRLFLEAARDRLLWKAPPPDLYEAISGVLTALPPRRARPVSLAPGEAFRTALLLEGLVDAARADQALASSARDWIVEHPGMVRISARELSRLHDRGVRWLALAPVRLLGVTDPARIARSVFPRGVRVWRLASTPARATSSRARGRRPSPK